MMTVERKNRVFIGGISDRIQKEDIEKEFCRFGKLTNVWVAQNPPGFAFVEYDHMSEADLAVSEMNGKAFLGSQNKIRVEHSHGGRSRMRRGPGGGPGRGSSFGSSRMPSRDRFSQGSGYRSNGGPGGYRRRDSGGYGGGGGGGGYQNGDKRRSFGQSGRFGGDRGGPPRYRSNGDRSYGMRRSRSPMGGHSGNYSSRMDSMPSSYPPVGNFLPNPNAY